jgi:predicted PilT family ATPase
MIVTQSGKVIVNTEIDKDYPLGKEITDYTRKYEGTDQWRDIMLAIQFGYQQALKYETDKFEPKA